MHAPGPVAARPEHRGTMSHGNSPLPGPAAVRDADRVSKTAPGEYHGFSFWVFDVCESILFAEMAAVAAEIPQAERTAWLADLEYQLRVHSIVGADFAIPLGQWCDGHEDQFVALLAVAGQRLAERGSITAQQAAAWAVLDGTPVIWRGQDVMSTRPAVTFAQALAAIIRGTYPQAPPGHQWYFGHPGEVQTIQIDRQ